MIKNKGFTLIELMVVMAIIGILVGLSLTAFVGSRKTARDGKRKADLEQIRSALEMYRADNDNYPSGTGNASSVLSGPLTGYLTVPSDPVAGRNYYYSGGGNIYQLCAALETGGTDSCSGPCGVTCNYKTQNP